MQPTGVLENSKGTKNPLKDLLKYFGFTVDHVVEEARAALAGK